MKKRLAILHTSFVFINVEPVIKNLIHEILPDVEVMDFVDSDVLNSVVVAGGIKNSHIRRMCYLAQAACDSRADVILSACSSLGATIDVARKIVDTPIVKIDDAMTRLAVNKSNKIGVLATVATTLAPTVALLEYWAKENEKKIATEKHLCKGAFDLLLQGDQTAHDEGVLAGATALATTADLIVLAQASMTRLAPMLSQKTGKEVLSSPRLAIEYIKTLLG